MFDKFINNFKKGDIDFNCESCGNCCREKGFVEVSDSEIKDIAKYLAVIRTHFIKKHINEVRDKLCFNEHPEEPCKFLKDNSCNIYPVRPKQCRTFPYWRSIARNDDRIKEMLRYCEGIKIEWLKKEEI
ncbi:MAG: YkgJ family cysteine cluster protein [Elusimicrobia bacterium]|jgi:Fe-S-cluster containining protein|nr:YkgJ family cysteine cluster protein [Elusimicrobiota bacterium]